VTKILASFYVIGIAGGTLYPGARNIFTPPSTKTMDFKVKN